MAGIVSMLSSAIEALRPPQVPITNLATLEHKFEPFSRLPQDIRWLIWELALPGPSIVTIYSLSDITSPLRPRARYMKAAYNTPPLLRVNREARVITQNHYLFLRAGSAGIRNGLCFAWKRDAINFHDDYAMTHFCTGLRIFAKVRKLPTNFTFRYVIIRLNAFAGNSASTIKAMNSLKPFGFPERIVVNAEVDDELGLLVGAVTDFGLGLWARELDVGSGESGPAPRFELMTHEEIVKDLEDTFYPGSEPRALQPRAGDLVERFRARYDGESLVDYWKAWIYASVVVPYGSRMLPLRGYLVL